MENNETFRDIINKQKEALIQLEAQYRILENSDSEKENVKLKAELESLRTAYENAKSNLSTLERKNTELKNALYEQIYNEKLKIINTTTNKMEVYFRSNIETEQNRLMVFEKNAKLRIDKMLTTLRQNNINSNDEIYTKLNELTLLLHEKVKAVQSAIPPVPPVFSEAERAELDLLKKEQITDAQIQSIAKKNNFERFVGLNVLNTVGIFLIIIGVVTVGKYTYVQLPDMLKAMLVFLLGSVMLVVGEFLSRKKPNIFSLGITAGGVGVLYVALVISYFGLHILGVYPAIVVCILITAVAFLLSNRYNSQTIMVFALMGGYLPMFSIGTDALILYGAMVYFVVLNLLVFMVSFQKKWHLASYIGLFFNICGTIYICFRFQHNGNIEEKALVIIYVLFAFLIYTLIPIISTYRTKAKFQASDIVLLALNTFFSSLIMYAVFYMFSLEDFTGGLAIVFAMFYLLFGKFIEKKFQSKEPNISTLFYLTGLAFVVLVVPLQFGRTWLSLGWLVEGLILTIYGIKNDKLMERVGFIIDGLCLFSFLIFDCLLMRDDLFSYKYFAITLGSCMLLYAYLQKKGLTSVLAKSYKYCTLVNIWFYTLYIIGRLKIILIQNYGTESVFSIDYLMGAASIICTLLIAYALPRIKILADKGMRILATVLYIIGILRLFLLNAVNSPIGQSSPLGITLIGTLILIVVGVFSMIAIRDLMNFTVRGRKLGMEWYPLIISGYFVTLLTQNLIAQYHLSFTSIFISIVYVLTALAYIIFGFMKRYTLIRKFGLLLAIWSVVKLFLIDLSGLTHNYKIVSYFSLGITLVAISFIYQYFSKRLEQRLEQKEEAPVNGQENH